MPIDLDYSNAGSDWIKKGRALAFTLTGITRIPSGRRRSATLTWDDGTIEGDDRLLAEIERRVRVGEWSRMTPTGPIAVSALTPLDAAAILVASLFESFETTGDFPEHLLYVPPGAIA